jgi:hypothetical protein
MLAASLTDTHGLIAIAAAALAVVAVACCAALAISMRATRRAQSVILGQDGGRDLVAHATDIQRAFEALRAHVAETEEALERRLEEVEGSLLGSLSNRALIHYDAYNELSGRQSMSIALLDGTRSGIVISCIHHRDQARVYAKRVRRGEGAVELSPEEAEAVRLAGTTDAAGDDVVERAT